MAVNLKDKDVLIKEVEQLLNDLKPEDVLEISKIK